MHCWALSALDQEQLIPDQPDLDEVPALGPWGPCTLPGPLTTCQEGYPGFSMALRPLTPRSSGHCSASSRCPSAHPSNQTPAPWPGRAQAR